MTDEKNLRSGLLKQNGLQADTMSDEDKEALRRILKRDRARVLRMKWLTGIAWALLLAAGAGAYVLKWSNVPETGITSYFLTGIYLLYPLAIVFVISLVIRSWAARNREFQFHRAEIEARLQRIEEAIKALSAGK